MSRVVAIVGMPGSGKSEAAEWFRARGGQVIRFGGLVIEEVARRGLPMTQDSERAVREDLRTEHGMHAMAALAFPEIQRLLDDGALVVIDGLYSLSEYLFLRERLPQGILLVAIHASPATRHVRLARRPERALTLEQAFERDVAELRNIEKGGPIALADLMVVNEGTLADLHAALESSAPRIWRTT